MKLPQVSPTDADETFIGKTLVSKNGCLIGTIKDIWKSEQTGKSNDMVITPFKDVNAQTYPHTDAGDIVLPSECVLEVTDVVIYDGVTRPPVTIPHKS